jgi:hypothetical protein
MNQARAIRRAGNGRVQREWLTLCDAIRGLLLAALIGLPAQAQSTTLFDLDQAICANDWSRAIQTVGMLVADERTSNEDRNALLSLRRQLEQYRSENVIVADAQACDRANPYLLETNVPPAPGAQPLGWDRAVAEVTNNQYSTEVITETDEFTLPLSLGDRAGLSPAVPVDLSTGLNVVSGHVGSGHEVYGFIARMGDRLDASVQVIEVMTGSLYTSDDSQLFIFDAQGNLIGEADDTSGQQSSISSLTIPRTDLYFAVVTSYNNDPIFNSDNRIMGWQDNGGGRFDYTLSISGVTPTSELVR